MSLRSENLLKEVKRIVKFSRCSWVTIPIILHCWAELAASERHLSPTIWRDTISHPDPSRNFTSQGCWERKISENMLTTYMQIWTVGTLFRTTFNTLKRKMIQRTHVGPNRCAKGKLQSVVCREWTLRNPPWIGVAPRSRHGEKNGAPNAKSVAEEQKIRQDLEELKAGGCFDLL